ncbi:MULTISPECIES: carboxylating nicotinate-nucleotide diphosphorylase [unclassified Rathayibacter]|uniref:carboxylating nicotinate-nucleotide diphosphorylase n=1 Tax=unclassified Rathayibacter TaxID=2609250 RepID=UPI00188D4131|nr:MULTISPECIES: carboxylating nicotinate-nucleotide diphosphorylase [unclassified Rathayibacter]MBF4463467.1 carboxylating nicotinate-nucleotide diphosphorylase [Rathayibacter sp. VKM Ac-2879]MBF4504811.1 carboxylating nicotinate-nucleotide diphosphorylase [Rathayibacter sp. VKM Ac-2878]
MLTRQTIERIVTLALEEDAPWGDVTSDTLIPADATASAALVAREPGVFSGGAVLVGTMLQADSRIRCTVLVEDGTGFEAGATLARIDGPAGGVLRGERVALNLVQRMSGIATLTSRYVAAVAGTRARIVDTRKTTPGLRALERHAVRSGGGHNHRFSLSDAILAKDNHLAILAQRGVDLTAALLAARASVPHTTHIEVEVDRLEQIEQALAGGADTIMLDNFTPEQLAHGVALIGGRAVVEASGGVNLDTVRAIAEAGVDVISVGALTHSVRSLDLGLDIAVA